MFHQSLWCSSNSLIIYVVWNDLKDEICLECTINTYREKIKCNRQTTHSQNLYGDNYDTWRFTIFLIQFYRLQRLTDKLSRERIHSIDRGLIYEGCEGDVTLRDSSTFMSTEGDLNLPEIKQDIQHEIKIGRIYVLHTRSY